MPPLAHSPASTKRRLPVYCAAKMSRKRASARATSDWNTGATIKVWILLDQKRALNHGEIRIPTDSNYIKSFRKCGFNPQKLLIWLRKAREILSCIAPRAPPTKKKVRCRIAHWKNPHRPCWHEKIYRCYKVPKIVNSSSKTNQPN